MLLIKYTRGRRGRHRQRRARTRIHRRIDLITIITRRPHAPNTSRIMSTRNRRTSRRRTNEGSRFARSFRMDIIHTTVRITSLTINKGHLNMANNYMIRQRNTKTNTRRQIFTSRLTTSSSVENSATRKFVLTFNADTRSTRQLSTFSVANQRHMGHRQGRGRRTGRNGARVP